MNFEIMLTGGDPRTLGKVDDVIGIVNKEPTLLANLFNCIQSNDQVVRMRVSDALEKICKQNPEWFIPYKDQLLNDWPKINQASVQWHLAQMLGEIKLTKQENQHAIMILKNYLITTSDWIVENLSLVTLASFTRKGTFDKDELILILKVHLNSRHKSVVSRVNKLLNEFDVSQ